MMIKELEKEAREKLADYVSAHFDVLYYQELVTEFTEDKGDKTMKDGPQVEAREGQITQELSKVEATTSLLDGRLGELETQLSLVLHPDTPSALADGLKKEPEVPLVPLAQRIREHRRFLYKLGNCVEEILKRLEIR